MAELDERARFAKRRRAAGDRHTLFIFATRQEEAARDAVGLGATAVIPAAELAVRAGALRAVPRKLADASAALPGDGHAPASPDA